MANEPIQEVQENTQVQEAPKQGGVLDDICDILETIFISIFVVILLFAYAIRPVTVEGHSMESTLQDGDTLLMSDFLYTPEAGDIVIVDNDYAYLLDTDGEVYESRGLDSGNRLIKRIIAVPGDTLDINFDTGTVYINGEAIEEDYIQGSTIYDEGGFTYPITIPDGYYFVMGDNRQNSTDSRSPYVGLIPEDAILGKAVLRITPFSNFGSIYD